MGAFDAGIAVAFAPWPGPVAGPFAAQTTIPGRVAFLDDAPPAPCGLKLGRRRRERDIEAAVKQLLAHERGDGLFQIIVHAGNGR